MKEAMGGGFSLQGISAKGGWPAPTMFHRTVTEAAIGYIPPT